MKTKVDTAVLNKSLHLGSAVRTLKRRFSWPLSRQRISPMSDDSSIPFSEAPSQTPSALQPEASGAVNQMGNDMENMRIKDPVNGSSVCHNLTAEQTNQDPRELRYFLKTSERCSYRGLLNQGATYYLNATLQVLFMTEAFREKVLLTPSDTSDKFESALKELFKELSRQDRGDLSVSTKGVIQALGIQRTYEQQDAVEYFLDILEKVGPNLAEVFSGTMRNNRICSENHESHDDSSFKSLQIALNPRDGSYRLEDGVQSYFVSTKLVGDDQMYCENCDEKRDTIWSCEIHKYPSILALHLKRFVKDDCPMDVPLHLSVQGQEYWLYAVINHRGSRSGGHYTADIRSSTENKWYCFDDSRVTETDERKLEGSREAYLLLYQKKGCIRARQYISVDSPPGYEMRRETLNSHADLTVPRTGPLLLSLTELQRSTATSSSVGRVEDVKEELKMQAAEAGEPVETGVMQSECGRSRNKPQLEVSAMTGRLRILVLGRPETDKNTLAEMIVSEVGFSSKSQLWRGKTIKAALEMCSPGPHMILWVAPLGNNKKDIEAFKEIYRFLGSRASKYIMIVFTGKSHPAERVKKLVSKLRKTVHRNHKDERPYYDKKQRTRKHKKTKNTHKRERASKRTLKSNHHETEKREKST